MDLKKFLKWHVVRGPLMRRLVRRAFMLVIAVIVVSVMQMAREIRVIGPMTPNIDQCPFNLGSNPDLNLTGFGVHASGYLLPQSGAAPFEENENLSATLFKEMMDKNLLQSNARALCVGEKSASAVLALRHLGFFNAFGVENHPFFSIFKRRFVYELNFEDNHFDFVFSQDLDRVSVPALLVGEIERVLRPGGTGAILVGPRWFYSMGLLKSVVPISSFLRSSDVIRLCGGGSFELIIFKKRLDHFASFEHFKLPNTCPSVANNKPFMTHIEPLLDKIPTNFDLNLSYLPNFMNMSSRNRLIYINIGAGEHAMNTVAKMSKPYCGTHHSAFKVFIIDHRYSVLSAYVTGPGIHYVYHPALGGGDVTESDDTSDDLFSAPMDVEEFDFVSWFKETVRDGDFVVLMMNAKAVELNILVELFKSGEICRVDEVFVGCPNASDCTANLCGNCVNLLKSLRKSGVYAHQWIE